ncbi:hypothetical protein ACI6PS_15855 [Flavobacterium sp. PLA-1-15]|uniref:hypothetical protein n=1 Tax=Flavobacterium sp. PLA-1-15 TaxID=3380533 RepID=UPI003B7A66F1
MKLSIEQENEIKRLQLTLLYGFESNVIHETPEQESKALDLFLEMAKQKTVTVYEKIGKPEFKQDELLSDEEVETELKRFYDLLASQKLRLDFALDDHHPRDIYRFVIGEFFDLQVPEVYTITEIDTYLYEDFVMNDTIEVKMLCVSFWDVLCMKVMEMDLDILDKDNDLAFKTFKEQYDEFVINHFKILNLNFSEEGSAVDVLIEIDFDGILEDIDVTKNFSGTSNMRLEKIDDEWETIHVDFPS